MSVDPGLLLSLLIIPLAVGHFWMLLLAIRARKWIWSAAILLLPISQFAYAALVPNRAQAKTPIILLLSATILSVAIIAFCVAMSIPINATNLRMLFRAGVNTLLLPIPF